MKMPQPVTPAPVSERRQFLKLLGGTIVVLGCGASACGGGANPGGTTDAGTVTNDAGSGTGMDAGAQDAGNGCPRMGPKTEGTNNDFCGSTAGRFDVGTPADYPSNGLFQTPNTSASVIIGRDANGLYALSSLCTPQCCDMANGDGAFRGTSVECVCHGSVFALDGSVISGPARLPLDAYALDLDCDGHLYADTTQVVANTVRLKA